MDMVVSLVEGLRFLSPVLYPKNQFICANTLKEEGFWPSSNYSLWVYESVCCYEQAAPELMAIPTVCRVLGLLRTPHEIAL